MKIDLNCDLGEGVGDDAAILPYLTSANLACGLHAGDASVMQATIRLAGPLGVQIGAHPGWPDRENFGRRELHFTADQVQALVLYQIGALAGLVKAAGLELVHVKPHGALYNQAARDPDLARSIARAVKTFSPGLILVGLAGSSLVAAGQEIGLRAVNEGFPDRAYNPDGTLRSRSLPGAVIEAPQAVAENALRLIQNGILFDGRRVAVETLCLHGDHPHAAENARRLGEALTENGVELAGFA
jgi:UPF0271 protein